MTYNLLEMITLLSILKTAILYYNFDSEFTKVSLIKILFCFWNLYEGYSESNRLLLTIVEGWG